MAMSYFAIIIEASNLLVLTDESKSEIWGCFCTRYIEGDDVNVALDVAKRLIQSELLESGILCDEKQLSIESVENIAAKPDNVADKGFTFYPMDDSNQH
jgi:hypothetical protein